MVTQSTVRPGPIRQPPPNDWFKANSGGSFHDIDHAGFGGVFRDCNAEFLGAFTCGLRVNYAIDAELLAVIEIIRVAKGKTWFPLWIETDSMLVLHYFRKPHLVPWRLRVKWMNSIASISQHQVYISHVFREANRVADKLANHGARNVGYLWWDSIPQFLLSSYGNDFTGHAAFRF